MFKDSSLNGFHSIHGKVILAVSVIMLVVLAVNVIIANYAISKYEEFTLSLTNKLLTETYEKELLSTTQTAASVVKSIYQRQDMDEAEKLALAKSLLHPIRFGTEGYFFGYELNTGINLIHGSKPELNGQNSWEAKDAYQNYYIQALNENSQKEGTFTKYYYSKLNGDFDESYPKLATSLLVPEAGMWIGTGAYIDDIESNQAIITKEIHEIVSSYSETALQFFLLLFVVSLLLIGLVVKKITNPIKTVSAIANSISTGDLDHQLSSSRKDEIGQLLRSFRLMIDYLQSMASTAKKLAELDLTAEVKIHSNKDSLGLAFSHMVNSLKNQVMEISGMVSKLNAISSQVLNTAYVANQATEQISAYIQQLTVGANEQAHATTQANSSVREMTKTIDGVAVGVSKQSKAVAISADLSKQMENEIKQVTNSVRIGSQMAANATQAAIEGAEIINTTINVMNVIQTKVDNSAEKMMAMNKSSEQVGTIIETIDDIASQINLLALNAAIEAARAGDHGRGFAVVADEVRKLAEKSSHATNKIASLLNAIKTDVVQAISSMNEGINEIQNGVQSSNQAGNAIKTILDAVKNVNSQVNGISSASAKMSESTNNMISAMNIVSEIVDQNSAAAEEMAAGSVQISQVINNIASVSEEYSSAITEVSSATEEMSRQISDANYSSKSLGEIAATLSNIIAQFNLSDQSATVENNETVSSEKKTEDLFV